MSTLRITYQGQPIELDLPLDRTSGGSLSGVLADLAAVQVTVAWPQWLELDLLALEGAVASIDDVTRYRVRSAGSHGNAVRFTLEPVELTDTPGIAVAGVSQDRWAVSSSFQALEVFPHWEITRTGPPESSVNASYPVVYGQVGAWPQSDSSADGGPTTPVIPLDSVAQARTISLALQESDGSPTASGTAQLLPIHVWPVTFRWTSGSVAKSASFDGTVWTGDGTNGTINATTGVYSLVLGPDNPDVDTVIFMDGSVSAYRAVVCASPPETTTVQVEGYPHAVETVEDSAGQPIGIVWLAGPGSTDQALYDGSTLEARWLYGQARDGGLGTLLLDVATASTATWDMGSVNALIPILDRYRIACAFTSPTVPLEWIRSQLAWAPIALIDGASGLRLVHLDMLTEPTQTIAGEVTGEAVVYGSDAVVGTVRVTWQGGTVELEANLASDAAVEIQCLAADEATARLIARHHAELRRDSWIQRQIVLSPDHPEVHVLQRYLYGTEPAILLTLQTLATSPAIRIATILHR